jgi:hypothetical protein
MSWESLSREELEALLTEGLEQADDVVREAWDAMRIEPEKWQRSPWGDAGGGFWVVAERDGLVVWFNDIEDDFNVSTFTCRGVIDPYTSSQGGILEVLLTFPEGQAALEGKHARGGAELPPALHGPGRIVKRQTTSWTLQPESGDAWRVHFLAKQETRGVCDAYDRVSLSDTHPALMDHQEPWAMLYLASPFPDVAAALAALERRVHLASGGWRSLDQYRNRAARLELGYGLLLRAPERLARAAADVLRECGAPGSLVSERRWGAAPFTAQQPGPAAASTPPPTPERFSLLQLGENFIVARGFRFERLEAPP